LKVVLTTEEVGFLEEPYLPHALVGLIPYNSQ